MVTKEDFGSIPLAHVKPQSKRSTNTPVRGIVSVVK
jgi:hypothetical protein